MSLRWLRLVNGEHVLVVGFSAADLSGESWMQLIATQADVIVFAPNDRNGWVSDQVAKGATWVGHVTTMGVAQ